MGEESCTRSVIRPSGLRKFDTPREAESELDGGYGAMNFYGVLIPDRGLHHSGHFSSQVFRNPGETSAPCYQIEHVLCFCG